MAAGLADLLRGLVSGTPQQVDPLKLVQQLGGMAGLAREYSSDAARRLLTEVLIPWAGHVALRAPSKWLLSRELPPICALENGRHCPNTPISACHICGRPVCVAHAMISMEADVVCWACAALAGKHAKKWQPTRAQAPKAPVDDLAWAYKLLGVDASISDADLKKAYRKMARRYHPDRAGIDKDGAQLDGQLLQSLNAAYSMLIKARKASRGEEP